MANRRMFALSVTDSDDFQAMPLSTQAIYFHLAMHADDDGFVGSPKRILKALGGAEDELRLLAAKGYVIPFNNGVCVIRHWKIHNLIQRDRYNPTIYSSEKRMLEVGENKVYEPVYNMDTACIQHVSTLEPQVSLGKVSLDKSSSTGGYANVMNVIRYCQDAFIHLTPRHYEEIESYYEDGITDEMMCYAVDTTVANGSRAWAYASRVIQGWVEAGINTIEAAKNAQIEFKARKTKQAPVAQPQTRAEPERARPHEYL